MDGLSLRLLALTGFTLSVGLVIAPRKRRETVTEGRDHVERRLDQRAALPEAKVVGYRVEYRTDRTFYLYYLLEGGDQQTRRLWVTAEELVALIHMFRHEGPVYFNLQERCFVTTTQHLGTKECAPAA
jgi:hypothetical protein